MKSLGGARLLLRSLAKAPSFSATVLLTLAVGIGAAVAAFAVNPTEALSAE